MSSYVLIAITVLQMRGYFSPFFYSSLNTVCIFDGNISIMHLNFLTNPDKNLQEKMRYFADYFVFTNEFMGTLPDLPFDNPISYTSKIIFQIDNNIKRCPGFIDNHADQLIHFFGDFLDKHTTSFAEIRKGYSAYTSCIKPGKKVTWLKDNPDFRTALGNLLAELEQNLFSTTFANLFKFITCKHPLKAHRKGIEFYTQILVSLFRFNNHSKKSVDEYIDRILSASRYNFPFPLEMYTHSKDEAYITKTEEFLSNGDFKKQFDGLQNLMINPMHRKGTFVYAINQVDIIKELQKEFKVKLDRVTFISPLHPQFKELRKALRKKDQEKDRLDKMYPRFFGKRKLLAYVELNYENKKTTSLEGAQVVAEELNMLNGYLETSLELQPGDFLFTEDFKENGWFATISWQKSKREWLDKFKHENLTHTPFSRLQDHGLNNHLLHNEKVFMKATISGQSSLFWQYIENLFWFQNVPNEGMREKFSNILSREIDVFTNRFLLHIGDMFYGMRISKFSDEFGMDEPTLKLLSSELGYQRNVRFPIAKYYTKLKHPFLKNIIKRYLETKRKKNKQNWKTHFKALILELQELRNAELHSGRVNAYAKTKMKELIPSVMNVARWAVINYWEDNKQLSFEKVIDHLTKPV